MDFLNDFKGINYYPKGDSWDDGTTCYEKLKYQIVDESGLYSFLTLKGCIYNKYFNDIDYENKTEQEQEKINKKCLDLTLDFLEPILKEGKLKVKIEVEYQECKRDDGSIYLKPINIREFGKNNYQQGISLIKNTWLSIDNQKDKDFFEMFSVQFTLPENKWND